MRNFMLRVSLASAALLFPHAALSAAPGVKIPVVNIGNGKLPSDAAAAFADYIRQHALLCGGKLFIPTAEAFALEAPKMALVSSTPIESAQRLNGIEWDGHAALFGDAARHYVDGRWGIWFGIDIVRHPSFRARAPNHGVPVYLTKKNGRWIVAEKVTEMKTGSQRCPP